MTPPYIQYMRTRNKMAAPQIRQNFHSRKVSILPMVSAELKPMCLSDGRTGGGMAALEGVVLVSSGVL